MQVNLLTSMKERPRMEPRLHNESHAIDLGRDRVTRLSTIMQVAGPTRGAVHFLQVMTEGFGQIGPDLDSEMRQQNIFGVVDSIRGVITSTRITRSLRSIAV